MTAEEVQVAVDYARATLSAGYTSGVACRNANNVLALFEEIKRPTLNPTNRLSDLSAEELTELHRHGIISTTEARGALGL
jgi:hypothetical protein